VEVEDTRVSLSIQTLRSLAALIAVACIAATASAASAAAPRVKVPSVKRTIVVCVTAKQASRLPSSGRRVVVKRFRVVTARVSRTTGRRQVLSRHILTKRYIVRRCAKKTTQKVAARRPSTGTAKPAKAAPPILPVPGSGLDIGLIGDVQGWGTSMDERMSQVTSTGVRWVREQFSWATVQPTRDTWDFSRYDSLMATAARKGVHVIPNPMDTPSWAGATWSTISDDPAPYAAFVAALAGRYGPGGSFWAAHPELTPVPIGQIEILNEPYYRFFAAGDPDAGRYARLVKASAIAGRAANPGVQYLIALNETYEAQKGESDWLADMYAAVPDFNAYYDGVAMHPYHAFDTADGSSPRLEAMRANLVARGASDKGFWFTEMGWSTCASGCYTEAQQAEYVTRAISAMRNKYSDYVRGAFFYRYDDLKSNPDATDTEASFGFVHTDGSPKPALASLRQAVSAG
jgi:hypothetical protein